MTVVHTAARAAWRAGLLPLPVAPDGSKRPDLSTWREFITRRPTRDERQQMQFSQCDGFGIVAGPTSGYRECWDFDMDEVFRAFVERAQASGLGALVDRLIHGYCDRTPGGGRRIIVEYPSLLEFKDLTLARRPGRAGEPKIKTLIELPRFAIVAPSNGRTHPTGHAYERLHGDFNTIASYTVDERTALLMVARTFDEMPRVEARPKTSAAPRGHRPGDAYNARASWPQILEPHGWTLVFDRADVQYWRRPDKTVGISATTNYAGSDLLYVFTSSTAFNPDQSYSKFAAYATLEHGGDFGRAAARLVKDGYGDDPIETDPEPVVDRPDSSSTDTTSGTSPQERTLRLTAASTIVLQPVWWLWDARLPVGAFSLIGGREGIGKSLVGYTLAASISTGTLPGIYLGTPKGVIIAATEDSWAHTIAPRLKAAGADLTKIYRADILDPEGFELPLSLPKDTTALTQAIKDVDAALVIFDPLLSRLDARLDSHKDADTRRALEPLALMAAATGVAVLGLIHVNKSSSSDALTLLMASRAFAAVARAVLFVATNPDNEDQRLLGQPKNNLGRMNLPTLVFRIKGVLVGMTAADDEIWTGQLVWDGESDQTIRQVLERASEREGDRVATQEAQEWLVQYLIAQGGTVARKTIMDMGRTAGHSRATLDRARHAAKIQSVKRGFPATSYWIVLSSSQSTQSTQSTHAHETSEAESIDDPDESTPHSTQSVQSPERESTESTESTDAPPASPPSATCCQGGPLELRCQLCKKSATYWQRQVPR